MTSEKMNIYAIDLNILDANKILQEETPVSGVWKIYVVTWSMYPM